MNLGLVAHILMTFLHMQMQLKHWHAEIVKTPLAVVVPAELGVELALAAMTVPASKHAQILIHA